MATKGTPTEKQHMRILFFYSLLFLTIRATSQGPADPGLLLGLSYGYQLPGGDLADRFGPNFSVGVGSEFILGNRTVFFGLEGNYLFGNEVKTNVLAPLQTPEGFIIANDKSYANIFLRERGFYVGGHVGKIFSLSAGNARSGIRVSLGAGLLQHKIRIQDDPFRPVAALTDEYKKGYDRLTNGLALKQFIGYQHLDPNLRLNFFAGFEFTQGFTRSRRDFNFDTRMKDDTNRLDLLTGFRVGWVLPFYFLGDREIFY